MPMLVMTSLADFFLAFSESRRVEAEGKDPSNPRYNVKLVLENKKEKGKLVTLPRFYLYPFLRLRNDQE